MHASSDDRLSRARLSLEGLSVGDAFGERFFLHPDVVENIIAARAVPAAPWSYTDDTEMALSIVSILRRYGNVQQEPLARSFVAHYDPSRGYGPAMHGLFRQIDADKPWHQAAASLFGGQGSFGNGAAMRVAPLGAYFADDLEQVVEQAGRSAAVTHAHPEAASGAIAVAVAAACAWQLRQADPSSPNQSLLDLVAPLVPESAVRLRIERARTFPPGTSVQHAVAVLGNGSQVSAQDTVAFVLWCAAQHLDDYEEALWLTASGLGDVDTTCAMVGGIVAMYTGLDAIPAAWRVAREPLPTWPFEVPANAG
jgi:ADP-ribosylglycohydrolase